MDDPIDFGLDLRRVRTLPLENYPHNFTFIVDGKEFQTNRIVADLLSPLIQRNHQKDLLYSEYYINTHEFDHYFTNDEKAASTSDKYFSDFLQLTKFQIISLNAEQRRNFSSYFLSLGNLEDFFRLNPEYFNKITSQNVVTHLIKVEQLLNTLSDKFYISTEQAISSFGIVSIDEMLQYIAQHFGEVNKTDLSKLSLSTLDAIISNRSLQLPDEDSLLRFIMSIYQKDHKYSPLFEYVLFNNVSDKALTDFFTLFQSGDMNQSIWQKICTRIMPKTDGEQRPENAINTFQQQFRYCGKVHANCGESDGLDGIMRYLTREIGGNIYDGNVINITSNSIIDNDRHPRNMVDFDRWNCYTSEDTNGSYVLFDFKEMQVQLTGYSLKSAFKDPYKGHLKDWIIEVSNDNKTWTEVDRRVDCPLLNGFCITHCFTIQQKMSGFHRFIRIKQIGKTWYTKGNHHKFSLCAMEFFGKLKQPGAQNDSHAQDIIHIFPQPEFRIDGIIDNLTRATGGNLIENATINITSNSIDERYPNLKNLVDFNHNNCYVSKDDGKAFICFDFKERAIQLSGYALKSSSNDPNGCNLKNWVIEVSNNNSDWIEVDRREDSSDLNGYTITQTFKVQQDIKGFYHFIRLRQTGETWWSSGKHNKFALFSVEFYGKLQ